MSDFTIKHKNKILCGFLIITCLAVFASVFAKVNYNMEDYLPEKAESTISLNILKEEFDEEMPNAKIMIKNISLMRALEYKNKLKTIDGITSITFIDDVVNLEEVMANIDKVDPTLINDYFKDNNAIFNLTIKKGEEQTVANEIYNVIGDDNALAGNAVNMAITQDMSKDEVRSAFLILIPIILVVLIITTTSWLEPILFLITIGVAVLLNMGTNFIMSDVSFITQSVAPILQFAVSLDYAIFLLHSFNKERKKTSDVKLAMKTAMKNSFSIIIASATTTIVGFIALLFMRFEIGANLGIVLVKGILFSFLSVMVLLPTLTLFFYKLIDKTKHKSFIPEFKKVGSFLYKIRIPALIIACILVIPCFILQSQTNFNYGTSSIAEKSRGGLDAKEIEKVFGKENILVILVPKGNVQKEQLLSLELMKLDHVTKVLSYSLLANSNIANILPTDALNKQFYSDNYARIIVYTNTKEEGKTTFDLINNVKNSISNNYDKYHLTGESMVLYDMKNMVDKDIKIVNLIAIIGILIVLIINGKSLLIPIILVFVIETAIWINLSITHFTGNSLSFIGYLIISTIQLGATVDYAILFTQKYLDNKKIGNKVEAVKKTLNDNLLAILTSAILLATAGFCLNLTSTNPVVQELGILLCRGTILSGIMVILVLPALLLIFDKFIKIKVIETTPKTNIIESKKN